MNIKKIIRKNAMVLAALAVAAGSFTVMSFGTGQQVTVSSSVEPALFWYEVDLDNNELGAQKNSTPLTKSQVMASPAITDCNDSADEICLRGYETEQNEGDQFTAPPAEEYAINQRQP